MNGTTLLVSGILLWYACTWSVALSCDSCGRECTSSCGTRNFRACCFNYLRKRASPPEQQPSADFDSFMALPESVSRGIIRMQQRRLDSFPQGETIARVPPNVIMEEDF